MSIDNIQNVFFFCCLYPLGIMQPFLFRHNDLSFASLSAVPHVSSIFFKSPSKVFLRVSCMYYVIYINHHKNAHLCISCIFQQTFLLYKINKKICMNSLLISTLYSIPYRLLSSDVCVQKRCKDRRR